MVGSGAALVGDVPGLPMAARPRFGVLVWTPPGIADPLPLPCGDLNSPVMIGLFCMALGMILDAAALASDPVFMLDFMMVHLINCSERLRGTIDMALLVSFR